MEKISPTTTNTSAKREFAMVIEPLELRSRSRLGNPARGECLSAFEHNRDGVRAVAQGALADARDNPLGLFVYRIRNAWHELEPLPAPPEPTMGRYNTSPSGASAPPTQDRGRGRCVVCEREADDALKHGGQWWCRDHEHAAA